MVGGRWLVTVMVGGKCGEWMVVSVVGGLWSVWSMVCAFTRRQFVLPKIYLFSHEIPESANLKAGKLC